MIAAASSRWCCLSRAVLSCCVVWPQNRAQRTLYHLQLVLQSKGRDLLGEEAIAARAREEVRRPPSTDASSVSSDSNDLSDMY